jgi:hypothetical protein
VDECDGDTGQKVDAKWIYTGPGKNNGWTSEGIVLDPKHKQPGGGIHAMSIAAAQGKKPLRNATICDPSIRTVRTSYLAVHGRAHLPGSTWPTADALWPWCDVWVQINTHAECGSVEDVYYYAPWRAPGRAPVIDSCGR